MKKVLFFAVLSFILLIYSVESYEMSVGISPLINASLTVTTNKTTYYQGDTVDIINTVENKGNSESIGNLTTRLFAPNGSEIFRVEQNPYWLDIPLELTTLPEHYSTSYNFSSDADFGIYTVTSNFTYENKIANASTEFELKASLTTVPPTEGEGEAEGEKMTTTLVTIVTTTTTIPTVETTTLVRITTTEVTTTTTRVLTMPAFVLISCLIWVIILVIIDTVVLLILRKKKSKLVEMILTLIIVSAFIILLAGPECLIWMILTTIVMITIAVWMKVRETPRKRRRLIKRKKR